MKKLIIILLVMTTNLSYSQENNNLSQKIISLEKAALERWNNGDPSGYIELSANDMVYFDPYLEQRLDGKDAFTKVCENVRGKIHVDRYEMINPKVQSVENMAVLTFNLNSYVGEKVQKWNSTEVYRHESDGTWKIIQSHWSLTKPF